MAPPPIADGNTYKSLIETALQTYKQNDLVYIDSNGTIAIATTSSGKQDSALLGQAARAATGTTGAAAYVIPFRPGDVYAFNLWHSTAASAVGTQATYAVKNYGLFWDANPLGTGTGTNSKWVVDLVNTTTEDGSVALAKVKVIDCPAFAFDGATNVIGDIYAVVHCIIMPFSLATDGTPRNSNMQWSSWAGF